MTDPRRQAWQRYFRTAADIMGLRDCRLTVDDSPPSGEAVASIGLRNGHDEATVYLGDEFLDSDAEEQRITAIHEVVHLILRHAHETIDSETRGPVRRAINRELEYAVDHLSRLIAPTVPLPECDDPTDSLPAVGVRPQSEESQPVRVVERLMAMIFNVALLAAGLAGVVIVFQFVRSTFRY